jgi:glycosyltransferase involved in cell wall biosynthesis
MPPAAQRPPQVWRALRLALVTETFPPEVNGVARTLGRWVDEFRRRGHHVQVLRPRQAAEKPQDDLAHGLPLPFYPQVRFGVASPHRIRSWLARSAADIVHIATEGPLGWATLRAASSLPVTAVSSYHTNYDSYLKHYHFAGIERLLFAYFRWFHNQARVTLVPSQATRQRLLEGGVRHVEIWSRGVDGQLFHPRHRSVELRRALGLSEDGVLLVYVGLLAAEKNLSTLLAAFARLRRQFGPVRARSVCLALVGGGPLAARLQAHKPEGVFLVGEQHGAALSRWYASADVFVFPSLTETFGNVLLEAQASGLPVVAFDYSVIRERLTHGIEGFLVPPEGDFADALGMLCELRGLRSRLGAAGRFRVEGQGWEAIFDDLEGRYLRLVNEGSPCSRGYPAARPACRSPRRLDHPCEFEPGRRRDYFDRRS